MKTPGMNRKLKKISLLFYSIGMVFLIAGLILNLAIKPVLAVWDESVLVFEPLACTGDCDLLQATVCNFGTGDMDSTSTFQVWWSPGADPQVGGTLVHSGVIPALNAGQCTSVSFNPRSIAPPQNPYPIGTYRFLAVQHPESGLENPWSGICFLKVEDCSGPTPTPTDVPPTPTFTFTPTDVPPTATPTFTSTVTDVPATATPTFTPTFTDVPPTATPEDTPPVDPTATPTLVDQTATPEDTPPVDPTATPTLVDQTATPVDTPPVDPTATPTLVEQTPTPVDTPPVDPTETPAITEVPEETPTPVSTDVPGDTPTPEVPGETPTTPPEQPATLPPPSGGESTGVLIPVTGADLKSANTLPIAAGLLVHLGFALFGLGLVTQGMQRWMR
jgi:hypothetical protein